MNHLLQRDAAQGAFPVTDADTANDGRVTRAAAAFVAALRPEDIPSEALHIGSRCIVDTSGLYAAGLTEESVRIIATTAAEDGGRPEALALGAGDMRVPMAAAARVMGISAHAHDFDDTQVSHDPAHVYGLLTHPTTAPLTAALAVAHARGDVDGPRFAAAFHAGFEVSCKISEWLRPDHYLRGHHSSGTVATFGAAMAAGKLMNLNESQLRHALGIAVSMAAGVRCGFGTMCKPLHVGRACENGVLAARLAARSFKGDPDALDGRWGFACVLAGGFSPEKTEQGFGGTWSILDPGVSIKPYPSGILTHQAMDMVLALVEREDVDPSRVTRIDFHAGDNILNPIRYPVAADALQAKFSMAALISMLVMWRAAGLAQFTDAAVGDPAFQAMQRKVTCHRDAEINSLGFDLIRSRVAITLDDGRTLIAEGDTRYRGGPQMPLTDAEVEGKARACIGSLPGAEDAEDAIVASAWRAMNDGPDALLRGLAALPTIVAAPG